MVAEKNRQTFIFTSYLEFNDFEHSFFLTFGNIKVTKDVEKDLDDLVTDVLAYLNNFCEIDRLGCEVSGFHIANLRNAFLGLRGLKKGDSIEGFEKKIFAGARQSDEDELPANQHRISWI